MMQVNLFSSQESLPVSNPHVISPQHHSFKSQCLSLDSQISEESDVLSFSHKPHVSNNNETLFSKDIFTIAQGPDKSIGKSRRLVSPEHPELLLEAAKELCVAREFVDVHLQCEDGSVAAHALILAIASPFLRRLLELEQCSETRRGPPDPVVIVLTDVRVSLVQVLLEFLYTGVVTTQEGQFYSLMKLFYDLDINASIAAEKTSDQPTKFDIGPVGKSNHDFDCNSCRPRKRARTDTFDSTINALFEASSTVQTTSKSINMSSHESLNLWPKSGGLVVNSLTASGVEVKQEPDEKPSLAAEERQYEHSDLRHVFSNKTSLSLGSGVNSLSTNSVNNNQLGHFVSVNPGYQVKLEIPSNSVGQIGNGSMLNSPPPNPDQNSKESSNPDDPLAAIMNQTIFGGEGLNMYIQVSSNVSSFVNSPHKSQLAQSKPQEKERESSQSQESLDDLACLGEDEETNASFNCDTCNRVMKGKVMLQAHKYQEHHENPEFESSSFPEDKYACRVCLKLFTRNSDVKAHILRVHCGDRRYPCTLCGKRFKESTHLRKHLYTHTGERPHFCSYCSKGFQTSSDLKRHKKTRVHQERVDQSIADNSHSTPETPTDKSMDASIDFNRWNDADDEELENTLNSAASRNSSSPFGTMNSSSSQPPTPPFSSLSNPTLTSPGGNQRNQNSLPFTTSASQFIQLPPRMSSNTLVFSNSNHIQQVQFLGGEPLEKSSWQSQQGLLVHNLAENHGGGGSVRLSSSPLSDVLSSLPPQNLGVQNLTLPSTTLDLSDIKWGILDPTVVTSIKRSGSTDSPVQEEERLTIQEDL